MEAKETSAVLYHSSVLACENSAVVQYKPAWVRFGGSSFAGGSIISMRLLFSFAPDWTEASHLCSWRWRNGFLYPVLKHGPRSLTYVRVYEWQTHMRNESNSGWTFFGHNPPATILRETGLSVSIHVGTRKMVNYAWIGWSRGKPRWRLVAVLTCKSIVKFGYRGERLIEPSSSWFPPKFPLG